MPIKTIPFANTPRVVDIADFYTNGKIFSDIEIEFIKQHLHKNGRYRYVTVNQIQHRLRYAVIVQDGKYFAIYDGDHVLGEGSFGKVKLAQDLLTGEWAALKVQKFNPERQIEVKYCHTELITLTKAGMMITTGATHEPVTFERYTTKKNRQFQQYLLMHLACGKDLMSWIESAQKLPSVVWLEIIIKTLWKVQYLHQLNLLHRDLKPENICYDFATGELTLIDFGFAVEVSNAAAGYFGGFAGTAGYVAPEISLDGYNYYNEKTEVYALGATFAYLLGFASMGRAGSLKCGKFNNINQADCTSFQWSMLQFIKRMVADLPSERPTMTESINAFLKLREELTEAEKKVSVVCLDAKFYLEAVDKRKINEALASYHLVCVVNENGKEPLRSCTKVKKMLEQDGQIVMDRTYTGAVRPKLYLEAVRQLKKEMGKTYKLSFYHLLHHTNPVQVDRLNVSCFTATLMAACPIGRLGIFHPTNARRSNRPNPGNISTNPKRSS